MPERDLTDHLTTQFVEAYESAQPLDIQGASSKSFLGNPVAGRTVSLAGHQGVTAYEPTELVVTARAGTPLDVLESTVAQEGQMLACEAPRYQGLATVGGAVASGLSGPGRPFLGGMRDCVLGVKMLNGKGQCLRFGGRVVKNVAGFDVPRLLCGSMGCLGAILEVTFKLRPRPQVTRTLSFDLTVERALESFARWRCESLPISAASWFAGRAWVRLSGAESAVEHAARDLGGEPQENDFWEALRDHEHPFFENNQSLWLLGTNPTAPQPDLQGQWFVDWAGARRWLGSSSAEEVAAAAATTGGFAWPYRHTGLGDAKLVREGLLSLHRGLCEAFDPKGILNPGRLHPEL